VSGTFELRGKTGRGEFVTSLDVGAVRPDESNRALRYLWARSRIAELSDYGAEEVAADRVKDITALGLKYNLLTRYTSFIAVREEVRNPSDPARDVKQPLPLPLRVSDLAVGDGMEAGSEPELVWLVSACFVLVFMMLIRSRRRRFVSINFGKRL
jgi:Ca-activated chloride channel family protein